MERSSLASRRRGFVENESLGQFFVVVGRTETDRLCSGSWTRQLIYRSIRQDLDRRQIEQFDIKSVFILRCTSTATDFRVVQLVTAGKTIIVVAADISIQIAATLEMLELEAKALAAKERELLKTQFVTTISHVRRLLSPSICPHHFSRRRKFGRQSVS